MYFFTLACMLLGVSIAEYKKIGWDSLLFLYINCPAIKAKSDYWRGRERKVSIMRGGGGERERDCYRYK